MNVSRSPLENSLYGPNSLKLVTSALVMPNFHGGSPAADAARGDSNVRIENTQMGVVVISV